MPGPLGTLLGWLLGLLLTLDLLRPALLLLPLLSGLPGLPLRSTLALLRCAFLLPAPRGIGLARPVVLYVALRVQGYHCSGK